MSVSFYERSFTGGCLKEAAHQTREFAGGEQHVEFGAFESDTQIAYVRSGSGNDIMTLAMWADGVKRAGLKSVAFIPYLPAARMDRGTPLGVKVYADFINSMGIDQIIALDPHSDVAPALYDRLAVLPLDSLPIWNARRGFYAGVIAPDLGARKRAEAVATRLGVPVYQASKHRDFATQELSDTRCEELPAEGNLIVVDDICDGGRTFRNLAEAIKVDRLRLHLWVTHGVFSYNATDMLREHYGEILTTDSHDGVVGTIPRYVTVLELADALQYLIKPRGI